MRTRAAHDRGPVRIHRVYRPNSGGFRDDHRARVVVGHDEGVAEHLERRGGDRRTTVDLTWPGYNERRTAGSGRRDIDQDLARRIAALPRVEMPALALSDDELLGKSTDELRAAYDALKAALEQRAAGLRELSEEDFQAVQVRDEAALVAAAEFLKYLEQLIVSAED